LMGRKTWDSLPKKPLPGRPNLVLTRDRAFRAEGAWAYTKLDAFLSAGAAMAERMGVPEICVIGGALLYAETLPMADRLVLTEVALEPEGDAHFPRIEADQWSEILREPGVRTPQDDADFVTRILQRRMR